MKKKYLALLLAVTLLISLVSTVLVGATGENEAQTLQPAAGAAGGEAVADDNNKEEELESIAGRALVAQYAKEVREQPADNTSIAPEFSLITENDNLALYAVVDQESPRLGEINLLDKKTGYVYRSNPELKTDPIGETAGQAIYRTQSQLVLTYTKGYNKTDLNTAFASVSQGLTTVSLGDNFVRFDYRFANLEFVIPVKYSLDEDSLKAEILLNDDDTRMTYTRRVSAAVGLLGDKVEQDTDFNITEIKLLPAFGATSYNESGYMFIPDGTGAIIYMNNGKINVSQPYSQPVYGNYKESKSDEYNLDASDRYLLPVFGLVKDDGHALMGIVTENAGVAYIGAEVSGAETAYNKVYSSYLNKIISKSIDKEGAQQPASNEVRDMSRNYAVNYYCLSGEEASYVGMAKRYRTYLLEEEDMKKSDSYREGVLFLDMYAGVEKQTSIAGIPRKIFNVLTTYEDVQRIVDELESDGVDNLAVKFNDWTKKSNRGKVQNGMNYEGSIGGKKGFAKTAEYLDSKGVAFYPNIDFINFSKSGNGFNRLGDSVKYTNQAPAYQSSGLTEHINFGTRWCLLKAEKVLSAAMDFAASAKKTGKVFGISLENFGETVYSDGAKGGLSRGDCINIWREIMKNYQEEGIEVLTTRPNGYAIAYSDVLLDIPGKETYVELADEGVPFYQIAVRGYKTYTTETVNMAGNPQDVLLNAIETGSSLLYSIVAGDTTTLKETYLRYLYSCNYDQWKDDIVQSYTDYSKVMKSIAGADIINHDKVSDGLYKTTYDNGVCVYVNYATEDTVTESGTVVPAKGYITERGE